MPRVTAEPLPAGCPWSGWTPPNVNWCEEELCSWVVNPADTWSNLAFIVLGVVMWLQARQHPTGVLRLFGPISVTVGAFSFAYHASYTYFLQFFDFAGMFLFCFTVITANALRLGWVRLQHMWPVLLTGVAVFSAGVPILGLTTVPIQSLVALLITVIIGQEVAVARREPDGAPPRRKLFYLALGFLAVAAAFSLADVTRTWCDPRDHILQGHAIWHLLSALALYTLYLFYGTVDFTLSD